jgi:DNA-binding NtrC family response regulator
MFQPRNSDAPLARGGYAMPPSDIASTPSKPPPKAQIALRVLIIDDDDAVCRQLREWIADHALEPVAFTRAREGLDFATRVPADLAFVDLHQAAANGNDVIAQLLDRRPDVRVIALAAFPDTDLVTQAMRAGARDLLTKPLSAAAVAEALQRQLEALGIAATTEQAFNQRLGQRLRQARVTLGATLADVASAAGITTAQLSQIELGRNGTSAWTLARIAAALRQPMSQLLREL